MKKLVGVAALALFVAVPAYGATATFGDIVNDVLPGTDVILSIAVAVDTLTGFQGVDMVVGWKEAGDLTFAYDAGFIAAMNANLVDPPYDDLFSPPYTNDVTIGGTSSTDVGTSIVVGQATFKTAGLAVGIYYADVDPTAAGDDGWSMLSLGAETEPISGRGEVRIIPEPASLMLLGLGAAVGFRRRRA